VTFQIVAYIVVLGLGLGLAYPYGKFMGKVFTGERNILTPIVRPVELLVYRFCGINENEGMSWKRYIVSLMGFELLGMFFVFLVTQLQGILPLNPQGYGPLSWDLGVNMSVSFVTNTNWTAYSGEHALSYMTQLLGVMVQDFISPAVGMSAVVALTRAFSLRHANTIGNFWVDFIRTILYVEVPLGIILVIPLMWQGVIQNFDPYVTANTLEGGKQLIPGGPASVITLFQMFVEDGTSFFNTSLAHPFANPTGLTYYLEMGYIMFLPASICFLIGRLTNSRATAWALFSTMLALHILCIPLPMFGEFQGNPLLQQLGVQGGLNLEGKEMRYSLFEQTIFLVTAHTPANGSMIAQHDSVMPLTVLQVMFNIVIGAPIFGCIGEGAMAMMHYFIVSMFLAGLMTGRTPEMVGKKLDLREIILASTSFLTSSFTALGLAAIVISLPAGLAAMGNAGPHGLTELLYAYTSASINNGSYMGGLNVNTPLINLTTPIAFFLGRYSTLLLGLVIAGSIARKGYIAVSAASLPVASPLFVVTVICVIILLSALAYFPAFALGPILEHFLIPTGVTF
jgi:potassium-transporting ATPase potassium-binding subunit